jgi:hypothetical protein
LRHAYGDKELSMNDCYRGSAAAGDLLLGVDSGVECRHSAAHLAAIALAETDRLCPLPSNLEVLPYSLDPAPRRFEMDGHVGMTVALPRADLVATPPNDSNGGVKHQGFGQSVMP